MRLHGIYIEYPSTIIPKITIRSMYKADGKNCWNQNKAIVEQQARALYKASEGKYNHIEIISVEIGAPAK